MQSKIVIQFKFNAKNELNELLIEELKGEFFEDEHVKTIVSLQQNHPYLKQKVIDYMKTLGYKYNSSETVNENSDINNKKVLEYFTKK